MRTRVLALLVMLVSVGSFAETQVAQLRLAIDTHPILNRANDGGADRVIFQDSMPHAELVLTVAAMPSSAHGQMSGLSTEGQWPHRVEWTVTTDDGTPFADRDPIFDRETLTQKDRGRVGVGEKVAAAYRLPMLPQGTYRMSARVGTLRSNVERFVVSNGTESVPLRTTYAWVQTRRERNSVLRDKWLRELGELDTAMPAPWIELGDEALAHHDLLSARQYFERATESYGARRSKFANSGAQELIRAIDQESALYGRVVAAVRSASSSGGRLVVSVQRDGGKRYVVSERDSGRVVQTLQ